MPVVEGNPSMGYAILPGVVRDPQFGMFWEWTVVEPTFPSNLRLPIRDLPTTAYSDYYEGACSRCGASIPRVYNSPLSDFTRHSPNSLVCKFHHNGGVVVGMPYSWRDPAGADELGEGEDFDEGRNFPSLGPEVGTPLMGFLRWCHSYYPLGPFMHYSAHWALLEGRMRRLLSFVNPLIREDGTLIYPTGVAMGTPPPRRCRCFGCRS